MNIYDISERPQHLVERGTSQDWGGVCRLLLFTCCLFELSAFLTVSTVSFLSCKTKGNTNVEGLEDGQVSVPAEGQGDSDVWEETDWCMRRVRTKGSSDVLKVWRVRDWRLKAGVVGVTATQ